MRNKNNKVHIKQHSELMVFLVIKIESYGGRLNNRKRNTLGFGFIVFKEDMVLEITEKTSVFNNNNNNMIGIWGRPCNNTYSIID